MRRRIRGESGWERPGGLAECGQSLLTTLDVVRNGLYPNRQSLTGWDGALAQEADEGLTLLEENLGRVHCGERGRRGLAIFGASGMW